MKQLILGIIVLSICSFLSAQNFNDRLDYTLEEWVKEKTTSNIILYNTIYNVYGLPSIKRSDKRMYRRNLFFWEDFVPGSKEEFVINFSKIEIDYPSPGYQFFEFVLPMYITIKGESVSYSSIELFPPERTFLVGINKNYDVIFLSGHLFKTVYVDDFDFTINTIDAIRNYISIELYNLKPEQFSFKGKRGAKYSYEFYSKNLERNYKVVFNIKKKDFKLKWSKNRSKKSQE